ncbi:MAG: hypothetical protein AAFY08_15080 [Planctomycetota bacterium]
MAEDQFAGGAYFEIGASLEPLERRLDDAQRVITRELDRVERVADGAVQQVLVIETAADRASGGVLGLIQNILTLATVVTIIQRVGAAMGFAAGAAAAIAAGVAAFVPLLIGGGLIAGLAVLGVLADRIDRAGDAARAIVDDIANQTAAFDGSADSVERLARAYERLPVVGGIAGRTVRIVAGDITQQERAWTGLVARIDETGVRWTWLGRIGGGVVDVLQRIAGQTDTVTEQIGDAGRAIERFNARLESTLRLRRAFAGLGRLGTDTAQQAERRLLLDEASPASRAELQGQFAQEDAQARALENRRQINIAYNQSLAETNRLLEEGEINAQQAERERADARREQRRAIDRSIEALHREEAALRRLTEREVHRARSAMLAAQERAAYEGQINNLLSRRRLFGRFAGQNTEADALEAELGGRNFDADRLRTNAEFDRRREAARFGSEGDVDAIERQRRARLALIDEQEARAERANRERLQQIDAEIRQTDLLRRANEAARDAREAPAGSQDRALAEQRAAALGLEATLISIGERFDRLISDALRNGNDEIAESLRMQRESEEQLARSRAAIDRQVDPARSTLAQQASRAEIAAAAVGGVDRNKPVVDALAKQTRELRDALERGVPATFAP